MLIKRTLIALFLASTLSLGTVVYADDTAGADAMTDEDRRAARDERRAQWESMSEEERQAAREERRAKWDSMSDEEKQAARERRAEHKEKRREAMRERWEGMSEEERQAAREKMQERSGHKGKGKGPRGPRQGGPNDEA